MTLIFFFFNRGGNKTATTKINATETAETVKDKQTEETLKVSFRKEISCDCFSKDDFASLQFDSKSATLACHVLRLWP